MLGFVQSLFVKFYSSGCGSNENSILSVMFYLQASKPVFRAADKRRRTEKFILLNKRRQLFRKTKCIKMNFHLSFSTWIIIQNFHCHLKKNCINRLKPLGWRHSQCSSRQFPFTVSILKVRITSVTDTLVEKLLKTCCFVAHCSNYPELI